MLVVIGTNIAILVYARTVTRTGEIAIRTALGASRSRVVSQLFTEALLLCGGAAALGLGAAKIMLEQISGYVRQTAGDQLPFWVNLDINFKIVAYSAGLAVLGSVIIGALPALKATGVRAGRTPGPEPGKRRGSTG